MVSEPESKKILYQKSLGTGIEKFGTEKSPGTGLEKIWYRKKSRNWSRKNLVPKKVSQPASKKYICTSDCNDHLVSLIMLPIIACQGYIRKVSQEMQ